MMVNNTNLRRSAADNTENDIRIKMIPITNAPVKSNANIISPEPIIVTKEGRTRNSKV